MKKALGQSRTATTDGRTYVPTITLTIEMPLAQGRPPLGKLERDATAGQSLGGPT
jgi:hypothetical protein